MEKRINNRTKEFIGLASKIVEVYKEAWKDYQEGKPKASYVLKIPKNCFKEVAPEELLNPVVFGSYTRGELITQATGRFTSMLVVPVVKEKDRPYTYEIDPSDFISMADKIGKDNVLKQFIVFACLYGMDPSYCIWEYEEEEGEF